VCRLECLDDDLNRALIAQNDAEACEQATIDHFQWAVKVFKSKKYKEGNEYRKRGASLRYPLEIRAFLRSQGQEPHESSVDPTIVARTFLNALSGNIAPLATSSPPTVPATGYVASATPEDVALPTSLSMASHKSKVSV